MNVDRIIHLAAGSMVLTSVALSSFAQPEWIWLAIFVGANLAQSGLTNFCPMATLLRKIGVSDNKDRCS
ncbi:MAG: DUF2892 domain-containing protein [Betaproteobacteria bacterium]|nr:MAG: DUF2892 domain-containing protein [Betaproteobacteria bacterium]